LTKPTEFTLAEAVHFYLPSGRHVRWDKPEWKELRQRIRRSRYSPFEYCHFIIHEVNDYGTANLVKMNMMTSPRMWDRFMAYKEHRLKNVRTMVRRQNEAAECYKKNEMPLTEILAGKFTSLNDVTRIELALFWREELEPKDLDNIIRESAVPAMVLAIGSPEFLLFTPLFRKYVEEQEEPVWSTLQKIIIKITKITAMPGK